MPITIIRMKTGEHVFDNSSLVGAIISGVNRVRSIYQSDLLQRNYSNLHLDRITIEALSLGSKFCCPQRKKERLELEVQFENLFGQTQDLTPRSLDDLELFKTTLVNCCQLYCKRTSRQRGPLTKEHMDSLKMLQQNPDILLSRPDKGAGIVILNRSDYIEKLNDILADQTKFRRVANERDKTEYAEQQITKCLKSLKDEKLITPATYEQLRPQGSTIPRLYGLPKVHKPGVPVRPILDMMNSPYHSTAKWLVKLLEPVRKAIAPLSLRDTFEFVECIQNVNMNSQKSCSLDVVSLFTNVPLLETVNFICDYVSETGIDIGLPPLKLKELLLRCTFDVQLLFNGVLYRQTDGGKSTRC
ncbi:hypothetical protein AHF37_03046 [Paragonimus kellicotti]|nr:hypothetical protein AHF37_03046 [Paragonimus kellicotti]